MSVQPCLFWLYFEAVTSAIYFVLNKFFDGLIKLIESEKENDLQAIDILYVFCMR